MSAFLDLLTQFDLMYIQVQVDASQFVTLQIGTPSLTSSVYTFPILQIQGQGTTPSNNTEVAVVIEQSGIGSGVTDHGALSGLADDDHLQYLHKDITRNLTVGYTTDIEADTFTDPLVPDFSLEYFKTMTVTNNFTLDVPTGGNGHGEYYLTVDSGGPYTLTAGTNVTLIDSNVTLLASENYILNVHRYSATNVLAQLLSIPIVITDDDAIHDNVASEISVITDKPTPVSGDHYIIEDSAASNAKKSVEHGALEAQFKKTHFTVITTSYTAAAFKIILVDDDTAAGAVTIDLPAAASSTDEIYNIVKLGTTASVTVDGNASETINGATTNVLSTQYDAIEIVCDGIEWFIFSERDITEKIYSRWISCY